MLTTLLAGPLPYTNNQIFAANFNVSPLILNVWGRGKGDWRESGEGGRKNTHTHTHTLDWSAEPIVAGNKINLVFIGTPYTSSLR